MSTLKLISLDAELGRVSSGYGEYGEYGDMMIMVNMVNMLNMADMVDIYGETLQGALA